MRKEKIVDKTPRKPCYQGSEMHWLAALLFGIATGITIITLGLLIKEFL